MKIHLSLLFALVLHSVAHPLASGSNSLRGFPTPKADWTTQALAIQVAAMGGNGLIQQAQRYPDRGHASPAKGVGDPEQLSEDFKTVFDRAQASGNHRDFELDLTIRYGERLTSQLLRAYENLSPVKIQKITSLAGLTNPFWLEDILRQTDLILVQDPLNPPSPFMVEKGWTHVGVATWRWNASTNKGTVYLSRGYFEIAKKEPPRILNSLLLYELLKLAAAKEHSQALPDQINEAALSLEQAVAGVVPAIQQSSLEAHISQVQRAYYQKKKLLDRVALFIVHVNVPLPQAIRQLDIIRQLLERPFAAVYENMGGVSTVAGGYPATLIHSGLRFSFKKMLTEADRARERIQVFVGGQIDYCLRDQIWHNLQAIKKVSHEGVWTMILPLDAVFGEDNAPLRWSKELEEALIQLFKNAGFSWFSVKRWDNRTRWIQFRDFELNRVYFAITPTIEEALPLAFPRTHRQLEIAS